MPRIPEIARPGLSLEVPAASANLGAAGAIGEGVSRLGAAVEGIGFDLAEKIKRAEAQTAVNSNILDDRIASKNYMEELKLKHPTGYVTEDGVIKKNEKGNPISVSEAYMSWANKRYHEKQAAMPSDMAQKAYQQEAAEYFTNDYIKVKTDERVWKLDAFEAQHKSDREKAKSTLLERPSASLAVSFANLSAKNVNSKIEYLYNAVEAKKKVEAETADMMDTFYRGGYENALAKKKGVSRTAVVDSYLSRLRSPYGKDITADSLTTQMRADWTERFLHMRADAKRMDLADVRVGMQNDIAAISRGDKSITTLNSALNGARILSTDQDTGDVKQNILSDGFSTVVMTRVAADFDSRWDWVAGSSEDRAALAKTAPEQLAAINKIIAGSGYRNTTPGAGQSGLKQIEGALANDDTLRTQHQQRDPVGYAVEYLGKFPQVRPVIELDAAFKSGNVRQSLNSLLKKNPLAVEEAFDAINHLEEKSKTPSALLSGAASKTLGDELQNFRNVDEATATILTLRGALGGRFAPVVAEMIHRGHLPKSFMSMAALSDDSDATKDVVFSLLGAKEVDRSFESTLDEEVQATLKKVRPSSASSAIAQSLMRGNVQDITLNSASNDMLDAINTNAKRLMVEKNMDAKSAMAASEKKWTSRFVQIFASKGEELFLPKSYTINTPIPMNAEMQPDDIVAIRSYLNRYLTTKAKNEIRPFDPSLEAFFERQASKGNFVFTWDNNGNPGVALQIGGNLGGTKNVVSYRAIDKKTNQPIFWKISDLVVQARAEMKAVSGQGGYSVFMGR